MVTKVFVVHDSKVEAYLQPFLARTRGEALRSFMKAANDERHDFSKYAEDYTLFEIGEYDDARGSYSMYETKNALGTALEMRRPAENRQSEGRIN